jgi:hypothetical protein
VRFSLYLNSETNFVSNSKSLSMKPSLVIFLFIVHHFIGNAQTYTPFPTDSTVWGERRYDGTGGGVETRYYQYQLSKDTLIQGKTWKQLVQRGESICYNIGCLPDRYTSLVGWIREENKKIFLQKKSDNSIVTLYDFDNLKVGDTLTKRNLWGQYPPRNDQFVKAIDSIKINETWRKRYQISNVGTGFLYFIEGIGSTRGLIPSYYEFEIGVSTICVRVGDKVVFGSGPCNVLSASEDLLRGRISISPNPVRDVLIVNGLENENTKFVVISNSVGRVFRTVKMGNDVQQISIYDLPNGFYLCQIRSEVGKVFTSKFIVAH